MVTYQIQFSSTGYPYADPADLGKPVGGGKEFFSQLSRAQADVLDDQARRDEKGNVKRKTVLGNGLAVAPVNIGPNTNKVAYGTDKYDDAFAAKFVHPLGFSGSEGRVFAGPRDDGFYVDIGRIFDLANLLGGTPRDSVAGYNCHAIAPSMMVPEICCPSFRKICGLPKGR